MTRTILNCHRPKHTNRDCCFMCFWEDVFHGEAAQLATLSEVHRLCYSREKDEPRLVKWLALFYIVNFTTFASRNQIPPWQPWSPSVTCHLRLFTILRTSLDGEAGSSTHCQAGSQRYSPIKWGFNKRKSERRDWCMDHNSADDPAREAPNWLQPHFIKKRYNPRETALGGESVRTIAEQAIQHLGGTPQGQRDFCSTPAFLEDTGPMGTPFSATFHFFIVISPLACHPHCISFFHHVSAHLTGGEQHTKVAYTVVAS